MSIVLNDKPLAKRIKTSTRERIINAAAKLNYHPSFMARSLYFGKTKSIGIVVGDIARMYFSELSSMALGAVYEHGYQALISATQWNFEREREALKNLLDRQVDGIIFFPGGISTHRKLYQQIVDTHFPVVVYDYHDENLSSVVSDYLPGIDAALQLLMANNHSAISYIGTTIEWNDKQVVLDSLAEKYGLELRKYLFPNHSPEVMENLANTIAKESEPQALIVSDDESALMLIGLLLDRGKKVPGDFDVVGIDGISWGSFARPALTSIKQDSAKLMSAAVELIMDMESTSAWKPKQVVIPTELIARETVAHTSN